MPPFTIADSWIPGLTAELVQKVSLTLTGSIHEGISGVTPDFVLKWEYGCPSQESAKSQDARALKIRRYIRNTPDSCVKASSGVVAGLDCRGARRDHCRRDALTRSDLKPRSRGTAGQGRNDFAATPDRIEGTQQQGVLIAEGYADGLARREQRKISGTCQGWGDFLSSWETRNQGTFGQGAGERRATRRLQTEVGSVNKFSIGGGTSIDPL